MNYILIRDVQPFVRAKLLQVVAIMTKRVSLIDGGIERMAMLDEIKQMIFSGETRRQFIAARMIDTLMQEFQTTIKSDDTGLTFDEHFHAKKLFEAYDLKIIFCMIFESVSKLLEQNTAINEISLILVEYVSILENILLWGQVSALIPKRLKSLLEANNRIDYNPSLRLSKVWQPIILDKKLLDTFFSLYWRVRDISAMQPKILTCLIQFSTLNGPVIDSVVTRTNYCNNFLSSYTELIAACGRIRREECYGMSLIFRKMLLYTTNDCLEKWAEPVRMQFCNQMYEVTLQLMEATVIEENVSIFFYALLVLMKTFLHTECSILFRTMTVKRHASSSP